MTNVTSITRPVDPPYVILRNTVGGHGTINSPNVSFQYPTVSVAPIKRYVQRVYSNFSSSFCYYDRPDVNPAPLSTATKPNHQNSIKTGSHEIVKTYFQSNFSTSTEYNYFSIIKFNFIDPIYSREPTVTYVQRVFDQTLSQYCYYSSSNIIPNPTASITRPIHTNNIKSGSFEIIKIVT